MLVLCIVSALIVCACGLFARLRVRPWWIWLVWLGTAIVAFIVLAECEPTWRQALVVSAVSSMVGIAGPEVWRILQWLVPRLVRLIWGAFRSIIRRCWRRFRRWIRRRPMMHTAYLMLAVSLLISTVEPQLGASGALLAIAMIALRVMVAGLWPLGRR